MSSVKDPQRKKRLSLKRDRRNTFGENSKSSRKNIPRSKQRQHMDERRAVHQALQHLKGNIDEDLASKSELEAKVAVAQSRNKGFKKRPDTSLEIVIARKSKPKS